MAPDRQPPTAPAAAHPPHPPHSPSLIRRWSLNASVRKAALAEEHAVALEAFRACIAAARLQLPPALLVEGDLDATLLRFLRARKYNVDHALAMLEKSLAWRSKVAADIILEQDLDPALITLVRQCRPSSYIGFDDQHHPIFLERLGKLDGKRFEREGVSDDQVLSYHLREMEFMAQVVLSEASGRAGHTVDQVVSIMDANGLTLSLLTGFAQRLFRLITAMDSDNYPETCYAIYILNGGATFGAIWRLVSPFVDKGTRDKVHVLGSGKAMQATLFKELGGRARVPTFLGGDLDYAAVSQEWYGKMDAVMSERAAHPRGHQPPIVLPPPATSANGHAHAHEQHARGSFSGLSGMFSNLSHLGSLKTGRSIDRHSVDRRSVGSADTDGWATPQSGASRFSAASGQSVYFDAVDTADVSPASSAEHSAAGSLPAAAAGGAPQPRSAASSMAGEQQRHHAATASGSSPRAGGVGGHSPPGSLSVEPHSCSRSQLSGFTVAGAAAGGGGGSAGAGGHSYGHPGSDDLTGLDHESGSGAGERRQRQRREDKQPMCGCVIS